VVVVERAEDGGHGAWRTDPPARVALGDTEEETIAEMRRAIEQRLAGIA